MYDKVFNRKENPSNLCGYSCCLSQRFCINRTANLVIDLYHIHYLCLSANNRDIRPQILYNAAEFVGMVINWV